ncbi:hypothetical protein ACFLR4_03290 [Bacteroidota bacterium]
MSLFSSKSSNQIEKLTEENDELKNTLHTVLQKHTSHMELENKIQESKKELARLTDFQKDLETTIQNLELEKIEKISLADAISTEITELDVKKETLTADIESIKIEPKLEEIKRLEQQLEDLRNEKDSLEDKITKLKTEESKKAASIKNIDERISLSDELKTNLDASLSKIISSIAEKESENNQLYLKKESYLNEIKNKQEEFSEFESKYKEEKDRLNKITDEIKSLEEKKSGLLEENKSAEKIRKELDEEILKIKDEEEQLQRKFDELKKQVLESEKRKLDIEEKHLEIENIFSETLKKFTEELSEAKSKLSEVKNESHNKEKSLNAKEKILLEKSFQIAEYGGLSKVLQKEKAAAEQALADLKDEHQELLDSISTLRDKEAQQKILLNELNTNTNTLQTQKDELEKKLKDFINQIHKNYSDSEDSAKLIKIELNEKVALSNELQNNIEKAKNELKELKEEFSQLDIKKEETTAKVSKLIAKEKLLKQKIADLQKDTNEPVEPGNDE